MLYQGLMRLMESTVLVHSTRADIKKIERHYSWVISKYQAETNVKLKLVTSKHPLKSSYYGRIVLSDKKSTVFVDVNLHKNVDKIADEVFTQEAAVHGKYKNPLHLEVKHLRAYGFKIMPRGKNITSARLDILLSTMHGDPRTQIPTICLKEESRKQLQEPSEQMAMTPTHARNRRKVTIPFITPPLTGGIGGSNEPMMSVIPAKYMFRQQGQDETSFEELTGGTKDLYNLENEVSSMEISSHMDVPPGVGQSAVWKNMPTSKMKSFAKSRPPKAMPRMVPKRESASPEKNMPAGKFKRDTTSTPAHADDSQSEAPSRPSDVSGSTAGSRTTRGSETTEGTVKSDQSQKSAEEKTDAKK
uniref:Uncharacterized protein n=2 Tax=Lygus hesperus TaxID=30085 RepID=A0A0K8S770_LYGHE